jgi:hypothetical protein
VGIKWTLFPESPSGYVSDKGLPGIACSIISCFERRYEEISSGNHSLNANDVLEKLKDELTGIGFSVRQGKTKAERIYLPVLGGEAQEVLCEFSVDAYHKDSLLFLDVEAGRGVTNNEYLKTLLVASMLADVRYLCIALRQVYKSSRDYEKAGEFLRILYSSGAVDLALDGVLLIGY